MSTTGDGFYIWNRNVGLLADIALYAVSLLALAYNAAARDLAATERVPRLRCAIHFGANYEHYQPTGERVDRNGYIVGDVTKQTPQTTYGVTKSIGELLINDYTRKGFIDGRSARLPTVIIRPGKPNAAASGFVSAVFREPLNGEDYVLPVKTSTVMPVLGYRAIVDGIIGLHEASGDALGNDRGVSLPSLTVTVEAMVAALERVAGSRALGNISVSPDPFVENICATWPQDARYDRATALGLPREQSLDEIVEYYIRDYVDTV